MSVASTAIEVLQGGVLSTIQDAGRRGHAGRGINPGGVMDAFALRAVNALLGNALDEAVLEMHFPAARLKFHAPALVCLGGADFAAHIDGEAIEAWRPRYVAAGSEFQFADRARGYRTYLGVMGGWDVAEWLGSRSTNLLAGVGGFGGRGLLKGDRLGVRRTLGRDPGPARFWKISPTAVGHAYRQRRVRVLRGPEWDWLSDGATESLLETKYSIALESNRTGYRLRGEALSCAKSEQLLSGGVMFGTVQLPPSGQPILLMADHPVTGGYPRIAQVIAVDLPFLAQQAPRAEIGFELTTQAEAELLYVTLEQELRQLREVCQGRMVERMGE